MSSDEDEAFKAYQEDSRIPCRYGGKCYQKNPVHLQKYKHRPRKDTKKGNTQRNVTVGKKRKKIEPRESSEESSNSPDKKVQKAEANEIDKETDAVSSPSKHSVHKGERESKNATELSEDSSKSDAAGSTESILNKTSLLSLLKDCTIDTGTNVISVMEARTVISSLFLLKMPEDFYQFYEMCTSISKDRPLDAFKDIKLHLVGPYDVFRAKFVDFEIDDKDQLLRHWRYYYDPPEFQTIIKIMDKDESHFGYWRDEPAETPVFVARNKSNVNCLIEPVAENLFGALDTYIEDMVKSANPFEKPRVMRLQQRVRSYAKEHGVTLEKKTSGMQSRQRKIVAKTFHKAGIVVPYNKRTQLGYRDLAVTDAELQKILKCIDEAESSEERKRPMAKLEEVVRLATIAADECDFGTCLELGHDLFSSGNIHVQKTAVQMLSIAYTHVGRPEFLEIARAHSKDRRKGADLSAL